VTANTTEQLRQGEGRITEEALERVYSQVGVVKDAYPWARELSFDLSRHFALYCLASDNPLWTDPDYARDGSPFGRNLVTPMTDYVAASADTRMGGVGLPGLFALHASDNWVSHRRLEIGDRVRATIGLADVQVRESKWGGRAVWQTREFTFYDQDDRVVSVYRPISIRAERRRARDRTNADQVAAYVYTDEEIDEIIAGYDSEEQRGAQPRYVEDVKVGDSIGHVVKGPLTVMDLMCWWMGAGGPYVQAFRMRHLIQKRYPALAIRDRDTNVPRSPEDAHIDLEYARRSGVALPFDIGRQRTASLFHLATNWAGDLGHVVEVTTRLTGRNYVGDTSWYRGTVRAVDTATGEVTCEVWADNQRKTRHTQGEVRIVLPRKS
jgi:acyl dehydratase